MRIGSSIFLLALGAVLAFALNFDADMVDLTLVGYILMGCGVIGVIWSVLATQRKRSVETHNFVDPNTGETVSRSESHNGF